MITKEYLKQHARPSSPFSKQPLSIKDLIPIELIKENNNNNNITRYICPVSKDTITHQKVILIKSTKVIMIEDVYNNLVKSNNICPITSKKIKDNDILYLQRAASGFSSSGNVEAAVYKPTIN